MHSSREYILCLCDNCGSDIRRRKDGYKRSKNIHNGLVLCRNCISKKNYQKNENFQKIHAEAIKKGQEARSKKALALRVTITCGCCAKEFEVSYGERDRIYCSRSCQAKSVKKSYSLKKTSICVECNKEFQHYGSHFLCSKVCTSHYLSKTRIGENNPAWKEKTKTSCLGCNKEFFYGRDGLEKGRERKFCSMSCFRRNQDKNDSLPKIPCKYPREFRKIVKKIREKYNHCCFLCGKTKEENTENLSVHHIDYNKHNCDENNLVPLCRRCHSFTNSKDKHFWRTLFSICLSSSKIVKKNWGFEVHVVNHKDYCLKYLIFFKDQYFSNHYHVSKKELWHCLVGEFEVILTDLENSQEYIILKEGDKLELEPKLVHQIKSNKNSIITEVSTQDFKEDSFKDYPSLL